MSDLQPLGRLLIVVGLPLAGLGPLLSLGGRVPGLGRLPGDIVIERGGFRLYLPLATSILLSLVVTGVLRLLRRQAAVPPLPGTGRSDSSERHSTESRNSSFRNSLGSEALSIVDGMRRGSDLRLASAGQRGSRVSRRPMESRSV